ncbi:ankyrin repeat, SAM and basic leucine zipper domain-containing protein 1-like isoform X1 [Rhipicephalus microplus]|uniref:ankyrin repeat, SAM and basic leucine zipper domain-containing protein 1-like isoform X1 n=1 Tax=Rhipicephalus microplus TaxID=6941 RepID=UPI003F6D484E
MKGVPADYLELEWSESDGDEIVFGDDDSDRDEIPKLVEPPAPVAPKVKKPEEDNKIPAGARISAELQEDFRVAVARGNVELARELISRGLDVNMECQKNRSALVQACNNGILDMVQMLIDHGADVNISKGITTPLLAVCSSRSDSEATLVACAEVLLKHGAEPDLAARDGATPIMLAARQGRCQLIELLLDRGANAKRQDSRGWTAVSWAAAGGQGRAARLLLMKVPFDLASLVTFDGQMPSDLAHRKGYKTLSVVLSKFETEFMKQGLEGARSLKEEGPWNACRSSGNYREAYGDVALVLAAIGAEERLPLFVQHGVSFKEMLQLDEEALCKMGIESEEERTKIIAGLESTRRFQKKAKSTDVDYELETFLLGVGMVELVETLREHGVSNLERLLKLDEEGLERAGITKVGLRSRLAAAIRRTHQLPWHKRSIPDLRKSATISCPEALSVVTAVRKHLGHMEVSLSHLENHLSKKPKDLELGRDYCSARHLREELREAHEALCLLSTQMQRVDQLVAKLQDKGCIQWEPQWPPLPVEVKRSKLSAWVPLCFFFTALWACKIALGRHSHWPRLPGLFMHRNM